MTLSEIIKLVTFVITAILGIVSALLAVDWYLEEVYIPTIPPPNTERVQNLTAHSAVMRVLGKYKNLSEDKQQRIFSDLNQNTLPARQWLFEREKEGFDFLCLGEFHNEYTRKFLAKHVFSEIKTDYLLLETTPVKLNKIMGRMEGGRNYMRLLDADVTSLIKETRKKTPLVIIKGIDETKRQNSIRRKHNPGSSRDDSIVANFQKIFKPGKRHIVLFGALHCSNKSGWMFDQIRSLDSYGQRYTFLNVGVFGEHQDGPLEGFVYFLDEIGLNKGSFVINDTNKLPPQIKTWFPMLDQVMLGQFQSIIVFRP